MISLKSLVSSRLAGALAVLAAAGIGGCAHCGGEPPPREREPFSVIPADSWIIASVELGPVRASKAYERALANGNPVDQYLGRDCQYDPLPDVERAWVGAGDGFERGRGAIVAFGSMDRTKILECFRAETRRRGLSLEELDVEGITVYSPGPGRPHLAWLDAKTLVVADRAHMDKVVALEKGKGQSVRTNTALLKLWERVSQGRDVAIAALPTEAAAKRVGALVPDAYGSIDHASQVAIGFRFMKGLDIYAMVQLAASDDAVRVHDRLTKDLARWRENDYIVIAGLAGHLKAVNVETAGREISASGRWTERQVDSVARLAVDSIDEILREGGDPEEILRNRLRGEKRGPDAGANARDGSVSPGDAGPAPASPAPASPAPASR
jgi:hypothetical protein